MGVKHCSCHLLGLLLGVLLLILASPVNGHELITANAGSANLCALVWGGHNVGTAVCYKAKRYMVLCALNLDAALL